MADSQRPLDEMRDYIRNFSLDGLPRGNQGYERVLLQLVGQPGIGKSTLINSCKCVLDDQEFIMYARATAKSEPVDTVNRTEYKLTPTISIVDNRPVVILDGQEVLEMYAQLGNFRPLNEAVNKRWTFFDFMSTLEDTELDPNYTDLIVPVLVFIGPHLFHSEDEDIKSFLRHCILMTGFTPIVVITHKAGKDTSELEKNFRAMGAEQIILVENYTTENHERCLKTDRDILTFLYNALQDVIFRMSHLGDKKRQRVERKKFLLKYIHDLEVEKKVHEARIAAEKRQNAEKGQNADKTRKWFTFPF